MALADSALCGAVDSGFCWALAAVKASTIITVKPTAGSLRMVIAVSSWFVIRHCLPKECFGNEDPL
jgi:hypothetical protein